MIGIVMNKTHSQDLAIPVTTLTEIINTLLHHDRRVLLVGQPGIGKSTLVSDLAHALGQAGRKCWCLGADPGSPLFGVPGAVCLGRWHGTGWEVTDMEALCTLDAGRFRLPVVSAVKHLARPALTGVVLVDSPGVVRGVAGAELLVSLVEAADIDMVLVLMREGRPIPLEQELLTLSAEVFVINAATKAKRPGKRVRSRKRTELWDAYLENAEERQLDLDNMHIIGTPPPIDVASTWEGRQIALLDSKRTLAMGEVIRVEQHIVHVRLPSISTEALSLLTRDAARLEDGRLGTIARFTADKLDYIPPPDVVPHEPGSSKGGPRVIGRVGVLDVTLVNGVFNDPLLHLRLRHQRRSMLFDLGEGTRLPARVAHQVTDVFISHAHIDHIAGFLWLIRSRIGDFPVCRIYGPPGLASNIDGLMRGILWDRVKNDGPRFEVTELHGDRLQHFQVQAGQAVCKLIDEQSAGDGVLLKELSFTVHAITLDHGTPVLAFAFEPSQQLNIRKDRLAQRGLSPGPWLGKLKRHLQAQEDDELIHLPDGSIEAAKTLADDLVLVSPGKRLVYATDFADTVDNRRRLIDLAQGAHTFFCEATFIEDDSERAVRTSHLTTRACGEIAQEAQVGRLVPFHFSRRYEDNMQQIYEEIMNVCSRVEVPRYLVFDD